MPSLGLASGISWVFSKFSGGESPPSDYVLWSLAGALDNNNPPEDENTTTTLASNVLGPIGDNAGNETNWITHVGLEEKYDVDKDRASLDYGTLNYLRLKQGVTTTTLDLNDDYIEWTISATTGHKLNLSSLEFLSARGGTGDTRGYELFAATDGATITLGDSVLKVVDELESATREEPRKITDSDYDVSLASAPYQNIDSVTFRYYPLVSSGAGTIEFTNMELKGSVITQLILDLYGTPQCAYSLRDLSVSRSSISSIGDTGGDTSGAWVVQVRRVSDDDKKSFTANEVTDGTLEAWVGTGDGRVSIWYDQSSSANNATQSVSSRQPLIVSSGSVTKEGGLPAIFPDGVDDWLNLDTAITGDVSTFATYRATLNSSPIYKHLGGAAATAAGRRSNGKYYLQTSDGTFQPAADHPDDQIVANYQTIGTSRSVYSNNTIVDTATVATANTGNIGRVAVYAGQYPYGSVSELIIYNTNQTANRSDISNDMMEYYNIS